MVQWLGLRVISAEDIGSVSGWGTTSCEPYGMVKKKKEKKKGYRRTELDRECGHAKVLLQYEV